MEAFEFNSKRYTAFDDTQDDLRIKRVLPLIVNAGNVLDVGCLDGTISVLLGKQGNKVYGIDASEPAVEKAKAKGIEACLGNIEERMPFSDQMFDLVFAGEIFEHIFDIDFLIDEIYRVTKKSGYLVATTPNLAAFGRRLMLLINRNPNIEISFTGSAAGHIRYFIKQTLDDLLVKHGFRVTHFTSDTVNFNRSGTIHSCWLAHAFPSLGRTLIVKAQKC